MTLTLEVPQELEHELAVEAAKLGLSLSERMPWNGLLQLPAWLFLSSDLKQKLGPLFAKRFV